MYLKMKDHGDIRMEEKVVEKQGHIHVVYEDWEEEPVKYNYIKGTMTDGSHLKKMRRK